MKLRNSGSIKELLQTCPFLKLYETDESKELKQFVDILLEKSLNLKYGQTEDWNFVKVTNAKIYSKTLSYLKLLIG